MASKAALKQASSALTLGNLISQLEKINAEIAAISAKDKDARARKQAIEADLMALMDSQQTRVSEYNGKRISITESEEPNVVDWDAAEASQRLATDPRPVHVALEDQRNVAGFGNEYVNEILFVRGILPQTPANKTDAAAIVDLGARMIRANRDRADRTFTGDPRPGRTTWVYRRAGRPCRRCGTLIRKTALGADPTRERIVFWCPRCQA